MISQEQKHSEALKKLLEYEEKRYCRNQAPTERIMTEINKTASEEAKYKHNLGSPKEV